jgi:hypothetical protein
MSLASHVRPRAVEHRFEVAFACVRERMEESVLALEDSARPGESGLRHAGRTVARLRGPSGVHALGPRAFGQVLDDAGGHASRNPQRVHHLRGVEAERARNAGRCA